MQSPEEAAFAAGKYGAAGKVECRVQEWRLGLSGLRAGTSRCQRGSLCDCFKGGSLQACANPDGVCLCTVTAQWRLDRVLTVVLRTTAHQAHAVSENSHRPRWRH